MTPTLHGRPGHIQETSPAPCFHNRLEPPGLYRHFVRHPPHGFEGWTLADGTPCFAARLDPLLTMDARVRRRLRAMPWARHWLDALKLRTLFVGTTVSEYAPLACPGGGPRALVQELLAQSGRASDADYALVVVKDLPVESPLLDAASNRHARELVDELRERRFVCLDGQALAWVPVDFATIDAHLVCLSRGARRDIRRKLRSRRDLTIETAMTGDRALADAGAREEIYGLYHNAYLQSDTQFDLLTRAFFDAVLQDRSLDGRVFLYRHVGQLIGFNLCFVVGTALVDKFVGFRYPEAREHNLYAVSWIHNLEYAVSHALRRYVAGWTDPGIKAHLGARFTLTRHAVFARNPALRMLLHAVGHRFEGDSKWLARHAPDRA